MEEKNETCVACGKEAPGQQAIMEGEVVKAPGTFKMVGIGMPDPKEEATAEGLPGKNPESFVSHPVCDQCYAKSTPGLKLAFFPREQARLALLAAQHQVLAQAPTPAQLTKQKQYLGGHRG